MLFCLVQHTCMFDGFTVMCEMSHQLMSCDGVRLMICTMFEPAACTSGHTTVPAIVVQIQQELLWCGDVDVCLHLWVMHDQSLV